jgi:hypothetical protein
MDKHTVAHNLSLSELLQLGFVHQTYRAYVSPYDQCYHHMSISESGTCHYHDSRAFHQFEYPRQISVQELFC